MRAANRDFAGALAAVDVGAAIAADDRLHGVLVRAAANREIARSLARLMPKVRRLERARFGSLAGRRSVEQHERIIVLCAAGEAEKAAEAVRENWLTLGALIDRSVRRGERNGIERFDRVPLLFGPSPVHRLERLSEHLGGAVDIWAKREDCNSGLAYGGNKVRKLEYLAADALAQGCDTLVSIGGVQSNHTRQVAAVAARLGLRCVLVQEHWVEWPDVVYDKVGNILLSRIMGADVRLDPSGFDIGIRRSWEDALASVEESGGKPYAIPAGASDHPLGGLGFARWADEVAEQERELGVFFDTIVVCSVTGSTQAGMVAGFAAQETDRAVLGIDGSATVAQTWAQIARIARATAEAIELGRELDDSEIVLLDEWHAGTYGIPDEKTIDAIRLCARLEGVLTDPVYEGKSMAALIDLVRSGRIAPGSRVLYAHLGGQPALNAYAGAF